MELPNALIFREKENVSFEGSDARGVKVPPLTFRNIKYKSATCVVDGIERYFLKSVNKKLKNNLFLLNINIINKFRHII